MPASLQSGNRASVLVVDDEMGVRESLRLVLGSAFRVLTADSGRQAFETLQRQPVDVVTLDVSMPGWSGIETLRRIREIDREVEVVMVTGAGSLASKRQAECYRVFDWIVKPFDTKQLLGVGPRHHVHDPASRDRHGRRGRVRSLTSDRAAAERQILSPSEPCRPGVRVDGAILRGNRIVRVPRAVGHVSCEREATRCEVRA
ncbi:MAG: response regulator transcription factor, partial [Candidatus Binatia bacterium]